MDPIQAIVLALIQGLTEFLPISSSAHLILPAQLFGWPDQGLAFDVAVHVGSLAAVMFYYRQHVGQLLGGFFASLVGRRDEHGRLAWLIILGTLPAILAGLVFNDFISEHLRHTYVIASSTALFGLALWWADRRPGSQSDLAKLTWQLVLLVGIAQAFALIPGTSRSGVTMTAALLLGLNRVASAHLSFLMSMPVILGAGTLKTAELVQSQAAVDWASIALGAGMSAVAAYACIHLFIGAISRIGMLPFVIYRLVLAGVLFAFFV